MIYGRSALLLTASLATILTATSAFAQAAPPVAADADNAAEIVVTGSRVVANGNSAPTPVTVLAKEQLNLAAPTSVADALAQVPEFRSSSRPSSFVTPQGATGAFLNLRGLGQSRVLVLLDGRRVMPTVQEGRVDVNTLPDLLLKRVDIVTGGASAAYGSDAVAGVVNFVLDDTFKGLKGDLGTGISSRGDNASYKARLAFGTTFGDDRFHLVASADWFKSNGVLTTDGRDWDLQHCNVIANPTYATDARTAFLWRCGVTGTQFATGGVITAGPLRGRQFLAGGVPGVFTYGSEVSAGTMVGGSGYWNPRGNVATPTNTKTLFSHLRFDASPGLTLYTEGSWSRTDSSFYGTAPSFSGTTGITIQRDNAYLDADTRQKMFDNAITTFSLGRISPDWGRNEGVSKTETYRGTLGFKAELSPAWGLDGSLDLGHTYLRLENNHSPNQERLFEALDAVVDPATGATVCRSSLVAAGAGRGCVPLNPFGYGSASAGALNYVFQNGWSDTYLNQLSGELNLHGTPFSTWAGDVSLASGYSYRKFNATQVSDPLSQQALVVAPNTRGMPASLVGKIGVFLTGNQSYQPRRQIVVHEGYTEVQVPLAKDAPLLRSLDVNGALRYANYSTTGGVWAWKAGASWEPFDGLRFRATRSRDVRAPNIPELYSPPLASLAPILDPVKGTNNNVPTYSGGNGALVPEIANTLTAGVVFRPAFVPGFSVSLDFYDIKIANAIGTLTAQNIVNLCAAGNTSYCSFVQRLSDGTLAGVFNLFKNQNSQVDRGVDLEMNYSRDLGGVQMSLRGLVSYLDSLATTDPFGTVTEQAGVNGGEAVGTPRWQGSGSVMLAKGGTSLFIQARVIGSGLYSNQYVVGGRATNSIDYNHVDGRTYVDLTLRQKVQTGHGEAEFYLTVNNLFDKDPPPSPTRIGAPASILGTNPTLYDVIGRQFNAGLRFKF